MLRSVPLRPALVRFGNKHEIESVKPIKAVSKAKLVFHLFDSNKSGKISKGEILDVLRYMVGANIGAENLEAIAERCLVEVRFGSNSELAIYNIGYMALAH